MELTGKCKEDFEKWLYEWINQNIAWKEETVFKEDVMFFYEYPESMKWGVYVDFFDSINIYIDTEWFLDDKFCATIWIKKEGYKSLGHKFKNRNEARIKCLKKANEIYNEKHI